MTDLRTAAQQALDFIRAMNEHGWLLADYESDMERTVADLEAALALAQAEPVQEPVAFIHRQGNHWEVSERHLDEDERGRGWTEEPLYTAPPPPKAEPVQEPEGGGNLPPPLREPEEFDYGIGSGRFKVVRGAYWWHVLIGESPTRRGKFHTQAGAEEMAALLLREFRNGAFVQHEAALAQEQAEPFSPDNIARTQAAWTMGYEARKAEEQAEEFCDAHCTWSDHAPGCVRAEDQTESVQEPVAKVIETAPTRIWLDLGFDPADEEITFDQLFEATWSQDNATGWGIEYVRADLAAPPKFVPLTVEEIDELAMDEDGLPNSHLEFARAIEQALKEKNR